jgi:hypothetical protein
MPSGGNWVTNRIQKAEQAAKARELEQRRQRMRIEQREWRASREVQA